MAATRQITYRLRPEGGADLVNEVRKVEQAGVQANTATEAAAERATRAAARQEAQWRRNAEAMRMAASAAQAQSQFNAALGVGGPGAGSASASADVFAAAFRADEDAARRAAQLKAEIDPLAAATDRYNAELREYEALQKRGALSTLELARAQELAKGRLDATTVALARNATGVTRMQAASRLNLTRQASDVFTTAAMGMNPAMIAIQQGPQIADAWAFAGIKVQGAMMLMAGAIGLTATAATVAAVAWHGGEKQALLLERAVTGLGRTSGVTASELEALAVASAEQGEVSIRSARAQAAAYVQTGRIGAEVIGGLIGIGKDYAAVMGLDAEEATQSLAKAMAEPDKAARELTRQIGLMDQATLDHIDTLVKQGDRLAAQKILLEALTGAVEGQADRIGSIESAWDAAARAVSNYWDKLGRALYTTPDERLANLDQQIMGARDREARGIRLRPGFIQGLEEERAELLRGQLDDQRRSAANADAAANQAAQLAEDGKARPTAGGGNSAERAARERLSRQRAEEDRAAQLELEVSRAMGDIDHVRALEDEAALRTRIRQLVDDDVAQADAVAKATEEQNRLLAARGVATQRALVDHGRQLEIEDARIRGDEATAEALEEQARQRESIVRYQEMGLDLAMASLLAETESWVVAQRKADLMDRMVRDAEADHRLTLARLAGRDAEVQLLERAERISARAREIERREGLNRGEGEGRARDQIDEEIAAETTGVRRDWVRGFVADIRKGGIRDALADQFDQATNRLIDNLIDKLFDVDWSAMFSQGGGAAPSGGGPGGWISAGLNFLFGGQGGGPGRNARGTDYWSGGWTWVGEEGPELIRAPRGAQIADADRSRRMAVAGGSGGSAPTIVHNYFSGNLMTPEFWAEIQKGDRMAARAGADRGAATAVTAVHGSAAAVQRADTMMRR